MTKFKSLIAFLMIVVVSFASAEQFSYSDNLSEAGFSLNRSATNGVTINHSISRFSIDKVVVNRAERDAVNLPGVFLQNDAGMPNLPGSGRYIAVPQGATASFNIVSFRKEVIKNVDLAPAPIMPLDTEDEMIYEENAAVYSANANYPESFVKLSEMKKIRGLDIVILGITPFQYNPQTKELTVYRDIQVDVSFNGGNGHFGEDRLRDREWDRILRNAVINRSALKDVEYKVTSTSRTDDYKYIIICPDDAEFIAAANQLKDFRTKQGIRTGVYTTTDVGGNTTSAIEAFVNNAYNTWDIPPAAVLLLGDYGTSGSTIVSPIYNSYCASDNIYADIDSDHLPEISFARMTAQNQAHLTTMIDKVINYETNPPTNPEFYNKPITALGWQTERWFQICSETVGGYMREVLGKEPTRINAIYSGSPNSVWSTATNTSQVTSYFGPSGEGYLPATPAELGGWTGGSAADVTNAINEGSFLLQHRDHGAPTGWGEPGFQQSHISGLNNVDNELPFIFSINCSTGQFNMGGECFAEKFHRHTSGGQSSGALGLIAATEVSYSFVNDTYVWGLYDFLYPDFMPDYGAPSTDNDPFYPSFANSYGKIFLDYSSWPYNTNNKEVTFNLFHHHSDAYLTVYSEVPQNLNVIAVPITAGVPIANVTADEGAIISLTVDGEIIGVAVGTGSNLAIDIESQTPADEVIITVTKQNYFRHEAVVLVTSGTTPYLVYSSSTLNDATAGNNNGIIDFGETINLAVEISNVGAVVSENITAVLSTASDFVEEIGISSATLSSLEPEASAELGTEFQISFENQIEDQTQVEFILTMTDDFTEQETVSTFDLLVNAPNFAYDYSIDPAGTVNPGDTIVVEFVVTNDGHSDAAGLSTDATVSGVEAVLSEISPISSSLAIDEVSNVSYQIIFDENISPGTAASIVLNISGDQQVSGNYGISLTVGVSEDFESGDFSNMNWSHGGQADWIISTNSPYSGDNCAASGDVDDYEESTIEVEADFLYDNGFISFYSKVSSEPNYDYLRFYIDGSQQAEWAGTGGNWEESIYDNISVGTHTLKWAYEKDTSVSNGDDCGYLDYIIINTGSDVGMGDNEALPVATTLYQNYPNPFNPTTAINFFNANAGKVNITVYNAKGQFVQEVMNMDMVKGMHKVNFNAQGLDSGLYFYTLRADGMTKTKKMILVK